MAVGDTRVGVPLRDSRVRPEVFAEGSEPPVRFGAAGTEGPGRGAAPELFPGTKRRCGDFT